MLSDSCYYEKLECDPYHQTKQEYSKLINNEKNGLAEKEKEYLLKFERKENNFYGLPKVHKSEMLKSKCQNNNKMFYKQKKQTI